uniref:Uncharacterized protein n=1 Tax=Arundo donax TaxID=35708 RepID=A0A0A8YRF9_ARUDO
MVVLMFISNQGLSVLREKASKFGILKHKTSDKKNSWLCFNIFSTEDYQSDCPFDFFLHIPFLNYGPSFSDITKVTSKQA